VLKRFQGPTKTAAETLACRALDSCAPRVSMATSSLPGNDVVGGRW
jgi:hypothetical protein